VLLITNQFIQDESEVEKEESSSPQAQEKKDEGEKQINVSYLSTPISPERFRSISWRNEPHVFDCIKILDYEAHRLYSCHLRAHHFGTPNNFKLAITRGADRHAVEIWFWLVAWQSWLSRTKMDVYFPQWEKLAELRAPDH
jgi:hypothetical protein